VLYIDHVLSSEAANWDDGASMGNGLSCKPQMLFPDKSILRVSLSLEDFSRSMGDHIHFQIPLWGDIIKTFGVVDGTREACSILLQAGEPVLVYPGGARELLKRTTDRKYTLMWKERTGFARMAIKHGCTIIPIASVGTEDMLNILYDIPAGWLFGGRDLTLPAVKPPSPDKLQRIYFRFAPPIHTKELSRDCDSYENCALVRDRCKAAIEESLEWLKRKQEEDPYRLAVKRLMQRIRDTNIIGKLYSADEKTCAENTTSEHNDDDFRKRP